MRRSLGLAALLLACGGPRSTQPPPQPQDQRCRSIDALILDGPLVERAAALQSVCEIRGDLIIGPTVVLDDVPELERLERVGGDLRIEGNRELAGLVLVALTSVGGDLAVERNTRLSAIAAPALRQIGGVFYVDDNPDLIDVALPALERAGGVRVSGNQSLPALSLPALAAVDGDVRVELNDALEHLDLPRLERPAGSRIIELNPKLR